MCMKKVIGLMAVCFMVSTTSVFGFNDVKTTDWYYNAINTLIEDEGKMIKGYPDGSFRPNATLTRDQFIAMVVRAAGEEPGNADGYWAQNYIDKGMELGLLTPKDFDSHKGPVNFGKEITREEMSMIIIRAVEMFEGEQIFTDLTEVLQVVKDSNDFYFKYEEAIMKTYKLGIITGYSDYTFKPQGVLTRAEASTVLLRLIDPEQRQAFDYEGLYNAQNTGMESHLLGGANWVDPVTATVRESAEEDWKLLTSKIVYSPNKKVFDLNLVGPPSSSDEVSGYFMYDEYGAHAGHLEDFERLLQRRMPQEQVERAMTYLAKKTDKYTYLEHDKAFFYLDNDKYLVRLDEVVVFEGTEYECAIIVNFNIWYRDDNFIENYEGSITRMRPYTDVVIYR